MIHAKVIVMKISKCKKELACIISEHGGWRNGKFAAQDGDGTGSIDFFKSKPQYYPNSKFWRGVYDRSERIARADVTIKNFHQTILSREEYFNLYPAADAKPEFCESVMGSIPEPIAKPTIDQLLQDWRNADDFAKRKQAEADEAGAMRDERWKVAQVKASELGVTIEVEAEKAEESELAITDWRDLRLGDEVEARFYSGALVGFITEMEPKDYDGERPFRIQPLGESAKWCTSRKFKFIRRP